jgi:16S rRNA processing protein RimM
MSSKSPTIEAPPREGAVAGRLPDRVRVGTVRRPHGLAGAVLVTVESDVPDRFGRGGRLHAVPGQGPARVLVILETRSHGDGIARLRFEGLETRDSVEFLRGAALEVDRSDVPPAPPDTYYHFELEGCRCRDVTHGELGRVVQVLDDGGGQLLVLRQEGGRELLIPFVRRFLKTVDVEAGEIALELPEGLVETCTSRS